MNTAVLPIHGGFTPPPLMKNCGDGGAVVRPPMPFFEVNDE